MKKMLCIVGLTAICLASCSKNQEQIDMPKENENMNTKSRDEIYQYLMDTYQLSEEELVGVDLVQLAEENDIYQKDASVVGIKCLLKLYKEEKVEDVYDIFDIKSELKYSGDYKDLKRAAFKYDSFEIMEFCVIDFEQMKRYQGYDKEQSELTIEESERVREVLRKTKDWEQKYYEPEDEDMCDGGYSWILVLQDQQGTYYTYTGNNAGPEERMYQFGQDLE